MPFFLKGGGTALGVGRGTELYPLPDVRPFWVVLVVPSFGVSTVDAYRWWDTDRRRSRIGKLPVSNDLQFPVIRRHPEIGRIVSKLYRAGAGNASMSGSGSAVFGLFKKRSIAQSAVEALTTRSRRAWLTRTLDLAGYRKGTSPLIQ